MTKTAIIIFPNNANRTKTPPPKSRTEDFPGGEFYVEKSVDFDSFGVLS